MGGKQTSRKEHEYDSDWCSHLCPMSSMSTSCNQAVGQFLLHVNLQEEGQAQLPQQNLLLHDNDRASSAVDQQSCRCPTSWELNWCLWHSRQSWAVLRKLFLVFLLLAPLTSLGRRGELLGKHWETWQHHVHPGVDACGKGNLVYAARRRRAGKSSPTEADRQRAEDGLQPAR